MNCHHKADILSYAHYYGNKFNAKQAKIKSIHCDNILDNFESIIDKKIRLTRKMSDFHVVKLECLSGRYVRGFGQAFDINFDDNNNMIFSHIKCLSGWYTEIFREYSRAVLRVLDIPVKDFVNDI